MPFYQGVELLNGQMLLTWDTAVDLQGDMVTYTIQISNTPDFSVLQTNVSTKDAQYSIPKLANGIYYLKVSASDSKGNTQVAFDRTDIGSKVYFGVYRFEVKTDSVAGLN